MYAFGVESIEGSISTDHSICGIKLVYRNLVFHLIIMVGLILTQIHLNENSSPQKLGHNEVLKSITCTNIKKTVTCNLSKR